MSRHHAGVKPAQATAAGSSLLQRWLVERQELLSRYCALSTTLKQSASSAATRGKLDRFCEVLVDYVSAGHFEVYRELLEAGERRGVADGAALYRQIVPTTAVALDFNGRLLPGSTKCPVRLISAAVVVPGPACAGRLATTSSRARTGPSRRARRNMSGLTFVAGAGGWRLSTSACPTWNRTSGGVNECAGRGP